jgi:hypothetical protein
MFGLAFLLELVADQRGKAAILRCSAPCAVCDNQIQYRLRQVAHRLSERLRRCAKR